MGRISSLLLYILMISVIIVLYYWDKRISKNGIRINRVLLFFLVSLFFGFRYCVGTDYVNYQYLIENMIINATEPLNAPLFFWGYILRDSRYTFVIYSLLTVYVYIVAVEKIYRRKRERVISLIIYLFVYFPHSLNTMREGLAIVLVLLAYSLYHTQKNIKKAMMVLFSAICIHNSMIIFVPIFLAIVIKRLYIVASVVYMCGLGVAYTIANHGGNIPILGRFQHYFGGEVINFGIGVIAMNVPLVILIVLMNIIVKNNKKIKECSIISINGIIVRHYAYINQYFYRFASVFNIFNCVLFANIPNILRMLQCKLEESSPSLAEKIGNLLKSNKIIYLVFIISCLGFIYQFYICNTGEIMNYRIKIF